MTTKVSATASSHPSVFVSSQCPCVLVPSAFVSLGRLYLSDALSRRLVWLAHAQSAHVLSPAASSHSSLAMLVNLMLKMQIIKTSNHFIWSVLFTGKITIIILFAR